MIKVLFVIPNLGYGGAEKVLINLANNMNTQEFDVTVLTLYNNGGNIIYLAKSVKHKYFLRKSFPSVSHFLKILSPHQLYSTIIKDKYDVVISYLEGQSARIVSGCDDKHSGLISWIHVEQFTSSKAAESFRSIMEMNRCYNRFDYIVCVSSSVQRDFQRIVSLKKPPIVIYNTIDSLNILNKSNEDIDLKLLRNPDFLICAMGTLKPSKGFDRLIRIHKRLIEDGCNVSTIVLGEGAERKKLESLANELNISDSFIFLGYQANPYKFLKASDLFVCTSYAEGFSTAVTESLIVGTPVCTVDVSGMTELLGQNNEYGIVTPNDEDSLFKAIKEFITCPEMQIRYKNACLKRSQYFDMNKTIQDVECLIKKCYEEKHG